MAITSPLSLGKISQSASSLKSLSKESGKKTIRINKLLSSGIERKKNLLSSIKIFRRRRLDYDKRLSFADKIKATFLLKKPTSARILTLGDASKSIADRLLGFIGYLSAGWILGNLPTWIALGEQFSSRLITAGSILSNYGDNAIRVMTGIGNVFQSALQNISRFDFSDSSYLVRTSLNNLRLEIDALGEGFSEALGVLMQPFKNIPELGTIQPDEPTPTQPTQPTQPPSGGNADFWTLVAVVSREDSDPQGQADVAQSIYNRAASGAYGSKNIRELILRKSQYAPTWGYPKAKSEQTPNKEWYQITDAQSAAKASGFNVGTIQNVAKNITNPSLQKEASKFVGGRTDFRAYPVSGGIQRKSGDNYFGWYESYKGTQTAAIPDLVGAPPVAKQTPAQTPRQPQITGQRRLQKGDIFTKSLGKDVSFITISDIVGSPRRHGSHGGIDISAPSGTYIALRVDAEWVAYKNEPGGYGHVLDLWIPSYGIQLRFAHLLEQPAKLSKIPAGRSFARVGSSGYSTGPHIHFEYDTKKGASRGGGARYDDPNYAAKLDQYVRLILLTRNPNKGEFSTPSNSSARLVPTLPTLPSQKEKEVEMQLNAYLNGISDGITKEREGRKIVVIDDRAASPPQIITSANNSINSGLKVSEFALLNNFMKNKLLLDLTYV